MSTESLTALQRWQNIDRLLEAALDIPEERRANFLREACAGDESLCAAVNRLLAAHAQASDMFEAAPATALKSLLHSQAQTLLGQAVADYEVLELLGTGGMGHVYLARDQRLQRRVALKILPVFFAQDLERVRRFQLEARAASALNHPNILTIYEVGATALAEGGVHFIATEFVEGVTLRQRMANGLLKPSEALEVAGQLAAALMAAHRAGIVHRDIKPENVMIRPDGLVKVLDFGLAKLLDTPSFIALDPAQSDIPARAVRGTPQYMSPEQARGLEVDARSDLFSLGVVLYEMLTGQAPFSGPTPAATLTAVLEHEPVPLSGHGITLPAPVEMLLSRCLEKDPAQRFATAHELAEALQRAKQALAATTVSTSAKASIAVLPFANLSTDPANEFLCDGLAEEVINALAKLQSLQVVARTSAFSFKTRNLDAQAIGRKLNASTVLEGSIRQSHDRIRITVQLINVANGYHLWAERYDRQLHDVFDIQDEITLAIVDALKVRLLGDEKGGLINRHPNNPDAYRFFLMGRFNNHKGTGEGFKQSIGCFERAIQLEPTYALARAALASTYFSLAFFGHALRDTAERCRVALEGVLPLDDNLAEVRLARALYKHFHLWDFAGAELEYKRAIELSPNYASAYFSYANFLAQMLRFEEAVLMAQCAEQMDPLSLYAGQILGWVLWYAGRYDETIAQAQKLLEMEPRYAAAYWMRGLAHLHQGTYDSAIADLVRSVELGGGPHALASLGAAYGLTGQRAEAAQVIDRLQAMKQQQPIQSYFLAVVYASLGQFDETFACLEKSLAERSDVLLSVRIAHIFDSVRDDARYLHLLERIGFPA